MLKQRENRLPLPFKNRWHNVLKSGTRTERRSTSLKLTESEKSCSSNYTRHPKPPYSYVGMIAAAIWSLPHRMATVDQIYSQLQQMFPFFSGSYVGWKSSVRHFLTLHDCFQQVKDPSSPKRAKFLHWEVLAGIIPDDAFTLQNTKEAQRGTYANDLLDHLNIMKPETYLGTPCKDIPLSSSAMFHVAGISSQNSKFPPQRKLKFESVDFTDLNNNTESFCNLNQVSAVSSNRHSQLSLFNGEDTRQIVCCKCYDISGLKLLANVASQLPYL